MRRRHLISGFVIAAGIAILISGCAYFNTFYNAKRKFSEAENDNRNRPTPAQSQSPAQPQSPGSPPRGGIQRDVRSPEKYRKVIETCSKLLEFYPKSRWVDDALYLMGVSYYRLGELDRADRKFTELVTIFPKSEHVAEAILFHARSLGEQGKRDEAITLLTNGLAKAKSGHDRAAMHFQLGVLYRDLKRWNDAAGQFEACFQLRPARSLAVDAWYQYGLCRYSQGENDMARDAFSRVVQSAADWEQTYQASVYLARTEMRLQHFEQAETILRKLAPNLRYSTHAEEIPLELADLTLESGRTDEAITLYQDYVSRYPTGTLRAIAYYRLALIHRDRLINLPIAKAYLDSTTGANPPAEIADSARTALSQISKGLLALSQVAELREELARIEASPPQKPASPPTPETVIEEADSTTQVERPDESLELRLEQSESEPVDSTSQDHLSGDSAATDEESDAEVLTETTEILVSERSPRKSDEGAAGDPTDIRRNLQRAYLHVAEFYGYSLVDTDSALHYYELAAARADDPQVYWKANLKLAEFHSQREGSMSEEAQRRYQEVVNADSVSIEAANIARSALGLPLLEVPLPTQVVLLHAAEEAYDRDAPLDSVLMLYDAVIALDSTSDAGQRALFAKAFIYEEHMHRMNWAQSIYEDLLTKSPNSPYADRLRRKLVPPDSESVFLLTDAQLMGARAAAANLLEETPDESGWPPPEESLQGRRYR